MFARVQNDERRDKILPIKTPKFWIRNSNFAMGNFHFFGRGKRREKPTLGGGVTSKLASQ